MVVDSWLREGRVVVKIIALSARIVDELKEGVKRGLREDGKGRQGKGSCQ